jgi:predicted RNA-binding Zn ribbon-like protein
MKTPTSAPDFQFIAGSLALDFVNTVGDRLGRSRDFLLGGAELTQWARLATLLPARESIRPTARQLAHIRTVREELYAIFQPMSAQRAPSSDGLALLSARCAAVAPGRRLHRDGTSIAWRWNASRTDPFALLGPILFDAAELLVWGAHDKLRECQDERCGWLFLDRSAAQRRRWCSMRDCGNRAKVHRYYGHHPRSQAV